MSGTQHSYSLITVHTPSPQQLTHITTKAGTHKICVPELNKLAQPYRGPDAVRRQIKIHNKGHPEQAGPADRQLLVRLGAISPKVQIVTLVSWSVAEGVLRSLKAVPDSIVQAIRAVKEAKGDLSKLTVVPFPEHVMAACSIPSTNPVQLQMTGPLPVNLPTYQLSQGPMGKDKYGLEYKYKALSRLPPLPRQLAELEQWSTSPIQLNRAARRHGSTTHKNTRKMIWLFLGFCRYHGEQQPTLQLFLSPDYISRFVAFKVAKQHSIHSVKEFLCVAREVLRWWQTKPGGKHHSLQDAIDWLLRLGTQVRTSLYRLLAFSLLFHWNVFPECTTQFPFCLCFHLLSFLFFSFLFFSFPFWP